MSAVGQPLTRIDGLDKVTGKAKYAEDYRVEGMLFAKLLVSPHPHARVSRLDTSAAEKMPRSQGCRASLAMAESLPPLPYHLLWCEPLVLTRDAKRDTIDDYAGCYLFHASLRSHVLRRRRRVRGSGGDQLCRRYSVVGR